MDHQKLFLYFLLYTCAGAAVLRLKQPRLPLFFLVNIVFVGAVWCLRPNHPHLVWLGMYVALVCVQFLLTKFLVPRNFFWTWVGILSPIVFLFAIRLLPVSLFNPLWNQIGFKPHQLDSFLGLSYMVFRLSFIAQEVKNGSIQKVSLLEYLNFAFFGPAITVGPITSGKVAIESLRHPVQSPCLDAVLKIVVGWTKYLFLGSVLVRITLEGIFAGTGRQHHLLDFILGTLMAYPYIYCNFSGFCDIVIGTGRLLGIEVSENFNSPFIARNVKEFWQRWHITLGEYLKNILFTPLSKQLSYLLGLGGIHFGILLTIFATFLFIGVWHGLQNNYLLFGALHGFAVAGNYLYAIFLKKLLSKNALRAYTQNRVIYFVCVLCTYLYVTATFVIFSYPLSQISEMWSRVVF